jgi:two-component system sensor histidine kinase UhpB
MGGLISGDRVNSVVSTANRSIGTAGGYSGCLRILQVVESERDCAEIKRLFEEAGLQFISQRIARADELQRALRESDWDALICDYQSHHPLGLAEVRRILWESGRDVPCILLVDAVQEGFAPAAMKSGARDYITKRDMARLIPVIEREVADVQGRRNCLSAIASLRDSEQRLRLALAASQTGIWQWDVETNQVQWSPECSRILHVTAPVLDLNGFLQVVHPDDSERVLDGARQAIETGNVFSSEFRIVLSTGEVRWVSNLGQAKYDEYGHPVFLVGTVQDITEHKDAGERLHEAQQEMERYSSYYQAILGRLHSIREQERARLAREIHDELGQSLTSLKLSAHTIMRALEHGDPAAGIQRVQRCVASIDALIQSVRDIASELRPPLLDQLGLAAALEWQCNLLRKQHGFEVTVQVPPTEPNLTDTQKITLFRIAQESLTNVMRHSGTQAARVSLEAVHEISLTISDEGKGILNQDQLNNSLGIMGMRERARLIGAEFAIEGSPGHGTTVHVRIPRDQVKGGRGEEKSAAGR